jgi:hypothetical protein
VGLSRVKSKIGDHKAEEQKNSVKISRKDSKIKRKQEEVKMKDISIL